MYGLYGLPRGAPKALPRIEQNNRRSWGSCLALPNGGVDPGEKKKRKSRSVGLSPNVAVRRHALRHMAQLCGLRRSNREASARWYHASLWSDDMFRRESRTRPLELGMDNHRSGSATELCWTGAEVRWVGAIRAYRLPCLAD